MSAVNTFYNSVISEVIDSLRSQFQEDGIDMAALQELKEMWEKKIKDSGALEPPKLHHPQTAMHFSTLMHPNDQNKNISRIASINNNASTRLIKPSGQNNLISEQNFSGPRVTLPVIVQGSNNFRQGVVPMVLNANQQAGLAVFPQYHNIIPQQNSTHVITDANIINLRKNQVDGLDDSDGSDSDDFINVPDRESTSISSVAPKSEAVKAESDEEDEEFDNVFRGPNLNAYQQMTDPNATKQEESDDTEDDDDDKEEEVDDDPLNTDDDISDDDPERIFDCDNVIVCQFDKVGRARNKWKLNFISGIAHLDGRDSVFHKALGEAEW